jgi:ATP adenylyltransferase
MHRLDILYAPWRYRYVVRAARGEQECIFCTALRRSEEEALVLVRGKRSFTIMNLYPYNTGHVMIAPVRHVASLEDLDDEELLELMKMVKLAMKAIREALNPHGFNIGMNIGRVAGAGIEDHVHIHVVPRWNGDTNFMPVVAGVKVIPQDVRETYRLLKPHFEKLAPIYLR